MLAVNRQPSFRHGDTMRMRAHQKVQYHKCSSEYGENSKRNFQKIYDFREIYNLSGLEGADGADFNLP
jgi:hypothetical protein